MADDGVCDGCGAMLPAPDAEGRAHCLSCGRINRSKAPPWQHPPGRSITINLGAEADTDADPGAADYVAPSTWIPTTQPRADARSPRTGERSAGRRGDGGRSSRVVAVGLLALAMMTTLGTVVFGIYKAVSSTGGPLSPTRVTDRLYPSSGSVLVLPGEKATDVALVVTDNGDDGARKIARVRVGSKEGPVWKSGPLPSEVNTATMATGGDLLYAGLGDQVRALDLATGAEVWTAKLTDRVTVGCPACFVVVGDALVVRSDDAYLAAFAGGSDEPRWTRRLRSLSARPTVVGGQLLLVDDPAEQGGPTVVERLDPATGKVLGTAYPSCGERDEPYIPFDVELDPGDRIVAVPGTQDAVAVFGSGYSCMARWEVATGAVRWAVPAASDPSAGEDVPIVTGSLLLAPSNDGGIVRYDLASGAATPLEVIADAEARPRAVVGGNLVGTTTTTRGTARGGLAGWDLASGRRLWTARVPGDAQPVSDSTYRSSDALFDGSPRFVLVAGESLRLFVFDGADRTVTTQVLDPTTGEVSGASSRDLLSRNSASGTPSLTVEATTDDALMVSIDGLLQRIPFDPQAPIDRWPPA